jgi:aspartyl-tRNA synthetase
MWRAQPQERDEFKAFGQERGLRVYDDAKRLESDGSEVRKRCGQLRPHCASKFNDRHKLLDTKNFQFLWVVDFPMFEWNDEDNRWVVAHHPFTSVHVKTSTY